MEQPTSVLTPDSFRMLNAIARAGSFAGAARELGLVPSALTYRVRQIEDALDVLLFDRSSRQARPTAAGAELLAQGERLRKEVDAVVQRVKRVATGWEPELTIVADGLISGSALMGLCAEFYAQRPPTRLRIREESLAGTPGELATSGADLVLGDLPESATLPKLCAKPMGELRFVFAVAPTHALATRTEPLSDNDLVRHRGIVVAGAQRGGASPYPGLLVGQETFTVGTLQAKLQAHLLGLGVGFLPEPMARPWLIAGKLVARRVERSPRLALLSYAWRADSPPGKALSWWLDRLEQPLTRRALIEDYAAV